MKKYTPTIILTISAIILTGISVSAQETRNVKRSIIINNGDTTVNGKKFSQLNEAERVKLREEFKEMSESFRALNPKDIDRVIVRKTPGAAVYGRTPNALFWNENPDDNMVVELRKAVPGDISAFSFQGDTTMSFSFNGDSLLKNFDFKIDGLDSLRKRVITMHGYAAPRIGGETGLNLRSPRIITRTVPGFADRNNSSSFNYNYVDKDGISSRMNIRISETSKEQVKKITGSDDTEPLEITDLTLFPNFSNGKMTLSFGSENKGTFKVTVFDNEFKPVFDDSVQSFAGIYLKQLTLPRNGIYYVSISQGGKWFTKRIIKE